MKKIIKYEIFESAAKLITLYHGGNLDYFDYTIKPTTTKRAEFGPGLYLTSKEEVARSYAKGSRKLYEVTLESGTELKQINISKDEVYDFFDTIYATSALKRIMSKFERVFDKYGDTITGDTMDAIIFNNKLVKPRNSVELIEFYVKKGADYIVDSNTFGWGEKTYVVLNLRKIKGIKKIK